MKPLPKEIQDVLVEEITGILSMYARPLTVDDRFAVAENLVTNVIPMHLIPLRIRRPT